MLARSGYGSERAPGVGALGSGLPHVARSSAATPARLVASRLTLPADKNGPARAEAAEAMGRDAVNIVLTVAH